jgi:hypothetical protein
MKRRSVPCCVALAAVVAAVFAAPAAAGPSGGTFSCKASAVRVALLGITLEPFVANAPDVPCVTDESGLINPTDVGPLRLSVLSARTIANPGGKPGGYAASEVVDLQLPGSGDPFPLLPAIRAEVLATSAAATCASGQPRFTSTSRVVNLRIGSQVIAIPDNGEPFELDLLVAKIFVNERIQTATRITRRALRISSPLLRLDVVAAESSANVEGQPCAPRPPQCSDGKDNDGDKAIDAKDPGCYTNGTYDPKDDDEYNAPKPKAAAKPACSDGKDNDGDKRADKKDPGCRTKKGKYKANDNNEYNKPKCKKAKKTANSKSSKRSSCKKPKKAKKAVHKQ